MKKYVINSNIEGILCLLDKPRLLSKANRKDLRNQLFEEKKKLRLLKYKRSYKKSHLVTKSLI